ncbi:MAG TPA: hypothetical protein VHB02_14510 [Acidimicrobiales bacterium]|nr:hypothetical protein [Acidimicrobiales bacterium]
MAKAVDDAVNVLVPMFTLSSVYVTDPVGADSPVPEVTGPTVEESTRLKVFLTVPVFFRVEKSVVLDAIGEGGTTSTEPEPDGTPAPTKGADAVQVVADVHVPVKSVSVHVCRP